MSISRTRKWGIVLTMAVLCGLIAGQSIPQEGAVAVDPQPVQDMDPDSMAALVGVNPPIRGDANPSVKSAIEALKTGKYPERLSAMALPRDFDLKRYAANPQEYLDTIEPGRVWQPAQPAEGVPASKALSPEYVEALQGEPVVLQVQTAPNAPVTFTSFDLGAFSNQLTSITVAADREGVALATYTGTPGTFSDNSILAASPWASGQVRFTVNVVVPKLLERQAQMLGKTPNK